MEELKNLLKGLVIIILAVTTCPYWLPIVYYVWVAVVVLGLILHGTMKVLELMGKL